MEVHLRSQERSARGAQERSAFRQVPPTGGVGHSGGLAALRRCRAGAGANVRQALEIRPAGRAAKVIVVHPVADARVGAPHSGLPIPFGPVDQQACEGAGGALAATPHICWNDGMDWLSVPLWWSAPLPAWHMTPFWEGPNVDGPFLGKEAEPSPRNDAELGSVQGDIVESSVEGSVRVGLVRIDRRDGAVYDSTGGELTVLPRDRLLLRRLCINPGETVGEQELRTSAGMSATRGNFPMTVSNLNSELMNVAGKCCIVREGGGYRLNC